MVTARFTHENAGHDCDIEQAVKYGLVLNKDYVVQFISMGQSYTYIWLKDFQDTSFNSVQFDFYEDGEPLDIFSDARFNPYL